jgi:hypothetical protein
LPRRCAPRNDGLNLVPFVTVILIPAIHRQQTISFSGISFCYRTNKETRFGELDSVMIDQGAHEITLRIEYQPSSGSAIIVGGLANLLLRSGTNKTIRTQLKIDVDAGHKYRLSAKATSENSLDVFIFDETKDQEVLRHSFNVKDGNFERVF